MMNLRKLGSKDSLGASLKEGIRAELCLKLPLKTIGVFAKLLSQDGFENDCLERKT